LILTKVTKTAANRCQISRLKCTKLFVGWGSATDPAGACSLQGSPRHHSRILGVYSKKGEETEGEGSLWEGRGGKVRVGKSRER